MASNRGLKSDDEAGFIRAYRDEVWDNEELYHVRIEFQLRIRRDRPGLTIYGIAYKADESGQEQVVATAEYPYPSHSATRLHAALYGAAVRLSAAIGHRFPLEPR